MAIIYTYPRISKIESDDLLVITDISDPNNKTCSMTVQEFSTAIKLQAFPQRYMLNGLVNNLASAGPGGYDFMEWVSNVTSTTQIPVMKVPIAMKLIGWSFVWMGDTALSIGVGEQVDFTIGTIPNGSNPIIGNYTAAANLFTLDNSYDGTWANNDVSGLNVSFNEGDIIAVVGVETGTVTPNTGELGITLHFESVNV